MDLTLCRSLLAVVEQGSIGGAAGALHVSQPALSRRIQQLEQEFGAELLVRSRRGVSLTAMGQLVAGESKVLVERFDRLKREVSLHLQLETGLVRIGGGATAVSYLLPSALSLLRKDFGELRFVVREAGSGDIEQAVVEGQLDLGIVTLPVQARDLEIRPLMRDRIVLIAGSGHPLADQMSVPAAALAGQAVVGFEAGSAIRRLIDDRLREVGIALNVIMELRSIPAIRSMVETTGSLGFISELGAQGARILTVRGLTIQRSLGLIFRRDRPLSPAALAVVPRLIDASANRGSSSPARSRAGGRRRAPRT